jgi:hypothetical protein
MTHHQRTIYHGSFAAPHAHTHQGDGAFFVYGVHSL